MGLGASFVDPIIRSYRAASSYQKDVLAKNIAENMFEIAMEESRDLGVGENAEGTFSGDYNGIHAEAKWWVFGSPELDSEHTFEITGPTDRWYTIPAAGSGNAGGDYCSTNDPAVTMGEIDLKLENLGVSTTIPSDTVTFGDDPFEWPCHWNKLYEGQTVSIPLYVDELGNIKNPVDLGLDQFELRIRAACNPSVASGDNDIYKGEICNSDERYVLDGDGDGMTDEKYEIIVVWEIVAEEVDSPINPKTSTGRSIILTPLTSSNPVQDSNLKFINVNKYDDPAWGTLNFKATSNAQDNIYPTGCIGTITSHINNNMLACGPRQYINKPILNFTLIHNLQDTSGGVPYLEYQFRTPVIEPNPSIASNEKLIRTEVMLDGGYSETIEKSIDLTKPVTGFVIQQ